MNEKGVLHYYQVYFDNPLDRPFTYSSTIPQLNNRRIKVSLRNKTAIGFVNSEISQEQIPADFEIKEIIDVIDDEPIITEEQKELAKWISEQYLSSYGEALGLFFPFSLKKYKNQSIGKQVDGKITLKPPIPSIDLTTYQEEKWRSLQPQLMGFSPVLIRGATGSGKTFFYLKIAEEYLSQGKQVLILVPEIALIFQLQNTCHKLFPDLGIGIYHSKLAWGAREKIRSGIAQGRLSLLISTRSGFFLSFNNLGLIIIDEEHENSYKNDASPRYQLKQVAYHWANKKKIPLVFVSATPTVELYHQVEIGKMISVVLEERYKQAPLPTIVFKSRGEELISPEVYREVFARLQEEKQVLFYINQRGYSSTVLCRNCQKCIICPNCDITLTFHKKKDILTCHYCGYRELFSRECECGRPDFQFIKAGTENYYEELEKRFSGYRIARFDSDTVTSPKQIQETLHDFRENKIQILIGTQMIIKGHDFRNVALVVVLAPERYLLLPDYRSAERMFSHIMQVSGRAGRNKEAGLGQVIIETDIRYHYSLQAAFKQSYQEFYQREIQSRKKFNYPPFAKLIRLVFRGKSAREVEMAAFQVKEKILKKFGNNLIVLGPSPCLLERHNNYFRWNILLKLKNQNYFLTNIDKSELTNPRVYLEIDVSPVNLF